ncbi:MAG: endolytic transglycosylase MltG [Bacteroidales bacterium]|nr:endolytic transglycosylase MltG [Bacteroidales bacterium]
MPAFIKVVLTLIVLAIIAGGILVYHVAFRPNVWVKEGEKTYVYIPTNANFEEVKDVFYERGLIIHRKNFEWLAKKKNYPSNIYPGRYEIKDDMSNNELINLLRSGKQEPVELIFNNIRTRQELAQLVSEQIEADSAEIVELLNDSAFVRQFNLTPETSKIMFIPNTYEFYWNTSAKEFIKRMYREYNKFWNEERMEKLKKLDMTRNEVVTLASIVEKETNKNDEKDRIAGVYLNRLQKGWRLQADPTLVYAARDFSIKRVLNEHKEIDSPYNTYKYTGLPPAPICIPSISSIKAVLNYEDHDYMYFSAKADMSGYHNFAKNIYQHNRNAKEYQKALDELNIKK